VSSDYKLECNGYHSTHGATVLKVIPVHQTKDLQYKSLTNRLEAS